MTETTITRQYSPSGLAAVRSKVADLLRSANKKGWNVDVTIDATEPYLRKIADRERFVVDATITFTGHFGFDGDWALVAVADATSTEEPLVFLLDDEFEIGEVDLARCDHCGRRARRTRAFYIRSAAGEVKQVGGSCAHEYLGVNLLSATNLSSTFSWDPDNEGYVNGSANGTRFSIESVLDAAIRAHTAFGFRKNDKESSVISSKEIVKAMVTFAFWDVTKYRTLASQIGFGREARVTVAELREWMRGQADKGNFGANLAAVANSDIVREGALGIAAYAPAAYDRWVEEQATAATAAPVPTGTVEIEGTIKTVKFVEAYGSYKIKVVSDAGWSVWGTLPRAIDRAEVGDRVRFTATVEPSKDDATFGFFKRPRNPERVAA